MAIPIAMITKLITSTGQDDRLCSRAILLVRITRIISVCVNRLSRNQPD